MPEGHLDLAVLQLVEQSVELARVLRVGIALHEPPHRPLRDVERVPKPPYKLPGRLRRRERRRRRLSGGRLIRPPQPLGIDERVEQFGHLRREHDPAPSGRLEATLPDLRQGVLPPQRPPQRAQGVAKLASEHPIIAGNPAAEERQGARHAVRISPSHGRQDLRQPPQPLPIQAERLRWIRKPQLPIRPYETLRHDIGEVEPLRQREPHERPGGLRKKLARHRPSLRRLERRAAPRRIPPITLRHPEREPAQLSEAPGGLRGEEHVPPLPDVPDELRHRLNRIQRKPPSGPPYEPPAHDIRHRPHRQEVPAYPRTVHHDPRRPTTWKYRVVRLRQHPDPHRRLSELQKESLQRVSELPLDERAYLGEGDRPERDRSQIQLPNHVWREDVPPRRKETPELHERRPQLLHSEAQPHPQTPHVPRPSSHEKPAAEHVPEPVARPDLGDPGCPPGRPLGQPPRDVPRFHVASLTACKPSSTGPSAVGEPSCCAPTGEAAYLPSNLEYERSRYPKITWRFSARLFER